MNIREVAQKQIDEIMDWEDFASASEALRSVKNCWINIDPLIHDDERENVLRSKVRAELRRVADKCIERYENDKVTYLDTDGCKFYDWFSDSGCIRIEARICDPEVVKEEPWFRINLIIYAMNTIFDGESFEK